MKNFKLYHKKTNSKVNTVNTNNLIEYDEIKKNNNNEKIDDEEFDDEKNYDELNEIDSDHDKFEGAGIDKELESESETEELESLIENAERVGEFSFEYEKSDILMYVSGFFFIVIIFFVLGLLPGRHSKDFSPLFVAPLHYWILDILFFIISFLLYVFYSTRYYIDLKRRKLVKEYSFFIYSKERLIADFSEIKILYVSTVVSKDYNKETGRYNLSFSYETTAVYGNSNKIIVLEINSLAISKDLIAFNNNKVLAASKLIGCKFIPSDGTSKITIKKSRYNEDIESLIVKTPKEEQLRGS